MNIEHQPIDSTEKSKITMMDLMTDYLDHESSVNEADVIEFKNELSSNPEYSADHEFIDIQAKDLQLVALYKFLKKDGAKEWLEKTIREEKKKKEQAIKDRLASSQKALSAEDIKHLLDEMEINIFPGSHQFNKKLAKYNMLFELKKVNTEYIKETDDSTEIAA